MKISPDFFVALQIKNDIKEKLKLNYRKVTHPFDASVLDVITVSIYTCIDLQNEYIQNNIGSGISCAAWSFEKYHTYFETLPHFYRKVSNCLYNVKLRNLVSNFEGHTYSDFIQHLCSELLTLGKGSPVFQS